MQRRDFVKTISIAGSSIAVSSFASLRKSNSEFNPDFELDEAIIDDLQRKMESGRYTSEAFTKMYLTRIDEIDKKGPHLNSVLELNPDAMMIAKQMDEERKNKKVRSQLHGIPV